MGRARGRTDATRASQDRGRRELCAQRRCDAQTGREPLSDRQRRRRLGQQGRGRQPGTGVSGGARRQRAGQCHRQRDDDRRIGLDQRSVPRRRGHQGARAQPRHRSWQRPELRRSLHRRMGRGDPGPAQQRSNADDGEFRHARRCARGLRDAGHAHRLRHAVPGGERAGGRRAGRYADGGRGRRARSLASARPSVCAARRVLSGSDRQKPPPRSLHALSQHRAERLGAAAQVRRRRLSRAARRRSTARATSGSATISPSAGRRRTRCGKATRPSSRQTAARSRR
jgi:hypothetical protein